jgi:hypothetical protein
MNEEKARQAQAGLVREASDALERTWKGNGLAEAQQAYSALRIALGENPVQALWEELEQLRRDMLTYEDRIFAGTVHYCMSRDLGTVRDSISATEARMVTTPQRIRTTDTGELWELGDGGTWHQLPPTEMLAVLKELSDARGEARQLGEELGRLTRDNHNLSDALGAARQLIEELGQPE